MDKTEFKVVIQCPDCDNPLTKAETRDYYCRGCGRTLNEKEIRAQCGL